MKNDNHFPGMDEFYNKFCGAIKESGEEQRFLTKWGLESLEDVFGILSNNVQGGYDSHKHSMLSVPVGGLLSELYDEVFVAEPDGENCDLLAHISAHYSTGKGKKASETVRFLHAGLSITDEAVKYWEMKRMLMKKRNLKGSILNFDIKDAGELGEVFHEGAGRVYLHKVLSSFSIAGSFDSIITQCASFLKEKGVITWSEPGYIFSDILQVEQGDTLLNRIKPVFDKNNITVEVVNYDVSNRAFGDSDGGGMEAPLVETWTLVNGWR